MKTLATIAVAAVLGLAAAAHAAVPRPARVTLTRDGATAGKLSFDSKGVATLKTEPGQAGDVLKAEWARLSAQTTLPLTYDTKTPDRGYVMMTRQVPHGDALYSFAAEEALHRAGFDAIRD
jgi:hypothetical protein